MKKRKVDDAEYYEGSTNVYADLGYANPEEWALKASIATKILAIIEESGLTQNGVTPFWWPGLDLRFLAVGTISFRS